MHHGRTWSHKEKDLREQNQTKNKAKIQQWSENSTVEMFESPFYSLYSAFESYPFVPGDWWCWWFWLLMQLFGNGVYFFMGIVIFFEACLTTKIGGRQTQLQTFRTREFVFDGFITIR